MSEGRIQVSIVTYNSGETIAACIESVLASKTEKQVSVTVFDNASQDNTCEIISNNFPQITLLKHGSNLGFGAGHNQAVSGAESDYILFLNPDAIIGSDLVDVLAGELGKDQNLAIAAPRLNYPDNYPQVSFGSFPGDARDKESRSSVIAAKSRDAAMKTELEATLNSSFSPDWVSGSCFMIRRLAWEQIGGFDEGYFLYFEDVDLCKRLRNRGWEILLNPAVICVHQEGGSEEGPSQTVHHFRNSKLRYLNKHVGRFSFVLYALLRRPGALFGYDPSLKEKNN